MKKISSQYRDGLNGWAGPEVLKQHFDWFGDNVPNISTYNLITDIKDKKSQNYKLVRQVLGKDILNIEQLIGDCVSWGWRNCLTRLECINIALGGTQTFQDVFTPFGYHTGRQKIGGGRINGDGSLGIWMQEAAEKFGTLFVTDDKVPPYSASIAKKWGDTRDIGSAFYQEASNNLVKTVAKVTDAVQAAEALLNGYFISVCSNRGFNMNATNGIFHEARGTWNHCMCCYDFGWYKNELYFLIMNSWGPNAHGQLKDFDTNEDLPLGSLRIRGEVLDKMLKQDDSYIYSDLQGFTDREAQLTKAAFDWFGT